jgi:hypothetical protein
VIAQLGHTATNLLSSTTTHHHIPFVHNPSEGLKEWEWRLREGREEQKVWKKRVDWEGFR